jgi:phospholipid transport system substrate-binding protein
MSDKWLTTDSAGVRRHDQESSSSHVTQHKSAVKPGGTAPARLAKGFTLALAVIAGVWAAPGVAAADEVPVAFIRDLGNQAVGVIRSDMPLASKAVYFEQMIHQDFDLTGICQFELGPYWRIASPAERQEFSDLFADHLVQFYGRQLAQSGGASFSVAGSRSAPAGVIVTSEIIRQSGSPIPVNWRLGVSDGHYKIEDVTIDGISMELTQRSEIGAMIGRNGGQFGALLATMRQED